MQQNPEEIKLNLIQLIEETRFSFPNLSSRLDEIRRWIGQKKPGLLRSKTHVMQFLQELLNDATFLFEIQFLSAEDREAIFAQLSSTEQYWYRYLFPAWINEPDPKLGIWKKKLMAGEFEGSDAERINKICQEIESLGGDTFNSYIADLSMATDLIASGVTNLPLCVQLTTIYSIHSQAKQSEWESTLKYWGIKRGIFISFNPRLTQIEPRIGQSVFLHSDQLQQNCYSRVNIDQ